MQSTNLIGQRERVYGRQATPEEEKVLQEFARQWVADESKRREQDRQRLARLMKKYKQQQKNATRAKFDKWVRKYCFTTIV